MSRSWSERDFHTCDTRNVTGSNPDHVHLFYQYHLRCEFAFLFCLIVICTGKYIMVMSRKMKKVKDLFVKKFKSITQMLMSTTLCFMVSGRVTRTETRSGDPSIAID